MEKIRNFLIIIVVGSIFGSIALLCGCSIKHQPIYYDLVYIAGEGGYIDGQAEQTVESGKDGLTVVAVPYDGYEFVQWSDGGTEAARQDKNVNSDMRFAAEFKAITPVIPAPKEYTLIYKASAGGYIEGETHQTIKRNENAEKVIAVPNEGYIFVKWSDNITEATRQDRNVTKDIVVKAIFEKQTYKLTYVAGEGGYLVGNLSQTVTYGESGSKVTAVPNDGYRFVKWSDGETKDTRQDTEINTAISVTAEFEFLFEGGEGTQLNPYEIENYTQLLNMRYYPDKCYKLTCDLDLSGINHEPIFDANEYFEGMFFGNSKTVNNLTVATESNFPSLFGMVSGGFISDLTLENVSITTTDYNTQDERTQYYVGTLAGYYAGRIDNVRVSGNIVVDGLSYDGVTVGGLVGRAIGTIRDCNVDVRINVKNVFREHNAGMNLPFVFGGMLGVGDSVKISNCHSQGEINVKECYYLEDDKYNKPTEIYIGGLVGYCFTLLNGNAEITESNTNITIIGDNHYNAGGFIGYLEVNQDTAMRITGCYVLGDITTGVVGGFICNGYAYGELLIENCYTDCEITGYSRAAGFIKHYTGSTDKCILSNCYSLSNIKTHNVFDAEIIVGEAWGFGYQLSNMEIINCHTLGNINSYRGAGFAWYLSRCRLDCCYSNCNITLVESAYSVFIYSLSYTEVKNCYSNDIINLGSEIELNTVVLIKRLTDSQISNFYYSGNSVGAFIDIVSNSDVINCHVLRSLEQPVDLIGNNVGNSSSIDITEYKVPEEMFFLADKLNEGQTEEVWINIEGGLPKLKNLI
ncbi:MAG: hypothetical protein HFK03_02650 [Clostridia bacterium]|jgi:hypothetical protein|nr:hypothetical protein [Clostridia bacterium]